MNTVPSKPILSDAWYARLNFVALILLPAIGSLYFALADIWNLPKAAQVVGTIVAIDTFLGAFLKYAQAAYNKSDEQFDATITKEQTLDGQLVYALSFDTREQQERANGKNVLRVKLES